MLSVIKSFVFKHKDTFVKLGVPVLVGVTAFAVGRYLTPDKVVVTEKVKVVEVEKTKWVEKVVEKAVVQKVYVENSNTRVHRETTETDKPDGSKEKKVTEDIGIDRTVNNTEIKWVDRVVEKVIEKEVMKYQDREKVVLKESNKAQWMITANVGVDKFSLTPNVVFGGEVHKRIVGPVWGGVWYMSNGSFGLNASMEF